MEHKIYTTEIVHSTGVEKSRTEVGTIVSDNGIIIGIINSGGEAHNAGWQVGSAAPNGDLFIGRIVS
tara:strand:- start:54 stop:254 length:201 start_codon:yes stop_codon:yes gene_type:complete